MAEERWEKLEVWKISDDLAFKVYKNEAVKAS
jgi:hypothetical protein